MDKIIFLNDMKNSQKPSHTFCFAENLPYLEVLRMALIEEKIITNHIKKTKNFKSNGPSVQKPFNHFNVKREPVLKIEQSYTSKNCVGIFSESHLAVCPAKNTACKTCNFRGHFTRL